MPVLLDHPRPEGSTGLTEAVLALTYDPSVLSVSASDITLGSIPGQGKGWQLVSVVDPATGQIGIQLYSDTPITATQAGSLVNIAFHVLPGATVPATAVQLVNAVTPNGQSFGTELADAQAAMILSPGVDRSVVLTGVSTRWLSSEAPIEHARSVQDARSSALPWSIVEPGLSETPARVRVTVPAILASDDALAVLSNGAVAGETRSHHSRRAWL